MFEGVFMRKAIGYYPRWLFSYIESATLVVIWILVPT